MLTAQLTGGLGNQLFTYSRLALQARKLDTPLRLDGSITERVLGHKPDLFDFKLMNEEQVTCTDYGPLKSQIERFLWHWGTSRKVSRRFQGDVLGNQNTLPIKSKGWKVRGFFQDFSVAEEFIQTFSIQPLSLKIETDNLKKFSTKIKSKPTLAIHMRRGDYLNYSDSFGVLSDDYYLDALVEISKKVRFEEVLIFTDSPELTDDICKSIETKVKVVTNKDLSTSETLVLMSRCDGLITSNSTYSFWAAILSENNNVVIPSPWFKSDDEWLNSANFNKPTWIKSPSRWIDK